MSISASGAITEPARARAGMSIPVAATVGAVALGGFGAAFSWRLDRIPRLASAAALTGVLAGGLGGAILASGSPASAHESRGTAATAAGAIGAGAGMLLLGGLAGIVLPSVSVVRRGPAIREFALYGAIAGGLIGAAHGARQAGSSTSVHGR